MSRSSAASAASDSPGRVAARPAATPSASGSHAHSAISSAAGSGSAAITSGAEPAAQQLMRLVLGQHVQASGVAPSAATSPVSSDRLVTTTSDPGEPGSSGRTWSLSRALSSTISTRLPSSMLRNSPARLSRSAGIRCGGTARASRK